MQKIYKTNLHYSFFLIIFGSFILFPSQGHSSTNPYGEKGFDIKHKQIFDFKPENVKSVQLEADQVQFSQDTNKATASGNVVVTAEKTILHSDQLELEKTVGEAVASGHVFMDSPQMQVDAETAKFNFNSQTGEFQNARIFNEPFQIKGKSLAKVSENHMVMHKGFMTTCDFDEPHFRMRTRQMDIYQGDKAIAQGVTMYLGKMPIMYYPKYVQDLKNRPIFTITPGRSKDFGAFLLSELHLKFSDNLKILVHGDFRERTGWGEGFDMKYKTPRFGSGLLRTYYTHERQIASRHLWKMYNSDGTKKGPTIRHERYRIEWRHQWQMDRDTNVLWQYYKIHDYDINNMGFIKRYFEREYRKGVDPSTFFLLTRNLPKGAVTFRITNTRVNPALQGTDYLPEVKYDLSGQRLGNTNFYLKTADTFSNIQHIQSPHSDIHTKTMRIDTNNEISYPQKVAFIELRPWIGGQHTYYSRTNDLKERSVIRGQFKAGSDLTTHFYRVWDYHTKIWGVEINGLRHVITPSASYAYVHKPTISASHFNQFDSIDGLAQSHAVHLSLENKLQTKRNKQSVDLLRTIVEADYSLIQKQKGPGRSLGPVSSVIEFNPSSWLSIRADESYDHKAEHWIDSNFDAYINGGDKWTFGIGKRYARHVDDELTTEWKYTINPKWKFKLYDRFIVDKGTVQGEDYILTRDLHEWEMDLTYHQERGNGTGIFMTFRLKAFPNMVSAAFSDSFHQRKAGSQSSTSEPG